ncbi:Ig-like domain-containing protein [Streptomyces sp. KM77-8]|uniref:Ig-like domain-containing protein n=1 Tax=Streptomyces haneummycinicus TaxID=3074435 RepID=A0AAT9HTH6_9ACTN
MGRVLLVIALGAGVAGCSSDGSPLSAEPYDASDRISFSGSIEAGKEADPDKPLEVVAEDSDGRITDVTVVDASGRSVAGELAADGSRWHSTSPLAAEARYTVRVSTEDEDGAPGRKVLTFTTGKPRSAKRLAVTFGPGAGTYGVGQPLTAELSDPVKDRAERAVVERSLKVESTPAVAGGWHWVDDKKLHYRPGSTGPPTPPSACAAPGGHQGQRPAAGRQDQAADHPHRRPGDRGHRRGHAPAHGLQERRGDQEIPVTTGKPGFETRNGVKVVLAKEPFVRMRSTTVGIAEGSSESYDLDVRFATRVTWSGEYVHAAPWSVGSQGYANVSHGCVGMSTDNAEWFFDTVREGDIVKVENSAGETMEPFGNGYGDWNLDWRQWQAGSALTPTKPQNPTAQSRLLPQTT